MIKCRKVLLTKIFALYRHPENLFYLVSHLLDIFRKYDGLKSAVVSFNSKLRKFHNEEKIENANYLLISRFLPKALPNFSFIWTVFDLMVFELKIGCVTFVSF